MVESIQLGEIVVALTRKDVKHVHLTVQPPNGRVMLVAPNGTRGEVARAYAISKIGWIRDQQEKMRRQARETERRFVERESHYLWGRRYLLTVRKEEAKPSVRLGHRAITLTVRPGSSRSKRGGGHARMAQVSSASGRSGTDCPVGAEAGCRRGRLLPSADEDEVGKLQSPRPHHTAQYRTREEAEGFA